MKKHQPEQQKIDHEFVPALHKLIHEEYHYLVPTDPRSHKQHFYNTGEINLDYSITHQMNLDVHQADFLSTQNLLETSTAPKPVIDLYTEKFTEQQKIIDILHATLNQDDAAFHEASVSLYGKPDAKLFWFVTTQIHAQFSSLIAKVDAKRKTLHKAYAVWKEYFESLTPPERNGVFHIPMYSGIYVPHDYEVDSAEKIYTMFSDYLTELDITNWVVKIDYPGARTSFGVNQTTKVISIPHDSDLSLRKKALTKISLQALLMHEVGVHVVRRENGDASPLALLGYGLHDYLRAEEGIATLAEQLIIGTGRYSGEIGYFSVGAAMGLLGNPLDFAGLYKVLNAYYTLSIADRQLETDGYYEPEELRMTATDYAWNRSLRVYRGTTGQTPGAVYTRDIIYLEGNKDIWKLLDSEPTIYSDWLKGKYDPLNESHIQALKALEILE